MGLILPQILKIKWTTVYKQHYINKGYNFTKYGDEFEINILDLPFNSTVKVRCICDYCKEEILKPYYITDAILDFAQLIKEYRLYKGGEKHVGR